MDAASASELDDLLARARWVRGLAGALVRDVDRADDLAQEAWARALASAPRQDGAWRGWFARTMKNRIADEARARAVAERGSVRLPPGASNDAPDELVQKLEAQQALAAAVAALPDVHRRMLLLHYYEGWSVARIAAAEGIEKRGVESRLRRAREALREGMERRAPPGHWAAGLVLLAGRPAVAPPVALAAGILAVALLGGAWWASRSGEADPGLADADRAAPALEAAAARAGEAAGAAAAASTEQDPTSATAAELTRSEAAFSGFDFVLVFVDAATDAPVPGVEVDFFLEDEYERVLETSQGASNERGEFVHHCGIAASRATVKIRPPALYPTQHGGGYGWSPGQTEVRFTTPLQPRRGVASGRIVDSSGLPVSSAFVDLWYDRSENGPYGSAPDASHAVASDGTFRIEPARSKRERLLLVPRAQGMAAIRAFEVSSRLDPEAEVTGLELALAPGRPLRVRVVNEQDQPIPGAMVAIWPGFGSDPNARTDIGDEQGRRHFRLTTDAEGWTPHVSVTAEEWQVHARHMAYGERQTQFAEVGIEELTITLPAGRPVSGRLLAPDGGPAPNVPMLVEYPGGEFEMRSDADGGFRFSAPGAWADEVRLQILPLNRLAFQIVGPITPEDLTAPLTLQLEPGLALRCELVLADGTAFSAAAPLHWEALDGPRTRAPGGDASTEVSWLAARRSEERGWFTDVGIHENAFHARLVPSGDLSLRFWTDDGWQGTGVVRPGREGDRIVMSRP